MFFERIMFVTACLFVCTAVFFSIKSGEDALFPSSPVLYNCIYCHNGSFSHPRGNPIMEGCTIGYLLKSDLKS